MLKQALRAVQIGIYQQALTAFSSAKLWLLLTIFAMFIYPQPVISEPASLVTPVVFWQRKASVIGAQQVLNAHHNRLSNVIVENVEGVVSSILSDDIEESRHQRFIMRLASGHTVLVVHNIDLAPRINGLRVGDRVTVKGEYEWNNRGGLIHWTHRDPHRAHEDGWIDHANIRYE